MDSTFPFSLSHQPAILGLLYVQISRPINPHSPPPFALKWCYFLIVVIWKGSLLFQRLSGTRFVWSHSIKPLHMFCFFYTSLIAMCAQHLLPCSFSFTVLYKALASLQNNPNNDWHTRLQKGSRKVKKARKIQRHRDRPLVLGSLTAPV